MARPVIASALLSVTALVAGAGCQTNQQIATGPLPGPNFAGPEIAKTSRPVVVPSYKVPPQKQVARPRDNVPTAWIPRPGAEKRKWNYIVIHHSAGPTGGAKAFDRFHREVRGWDELGYHFVIGNGTDTADGQIEVGPRWTTQKHGAHAKTPDNKYNDHGIGICLVGNFENQRPTAKQMASLTRLVAYLADTYRIPPGNIIGHKMTGKVTDCPGRYMDVAAVRAAVARQLAAAPSAPEPAIDPTVELMGNARASLGSESTAR